MRSIFLVAAFALAGPAQAHDFWLQPRSFRMAAPGVAPTSIQIGHGDAREAWAVQPERIPLFRSFSPAGAADLRRFLRSGPQDQRLAFIGAGVHVLALETSPIPSVLPAVRFNDYAREEGLTPALQGRQRAGRMQTAGREIYSRRAKALVQVGPTAGAAQPHVTKPIGLTLEIVPLRNPYALRRGESLPVQVLYRGRPLPGALIKLTDLKRDEKPLQTRRTDQKGFATFQPRAGGEWLLNVVWTRPLEGDPRADFDTVFSSLSFELPPAAK